MKDKEVKEMLDSHKKWMRGELGGIFANFQNADLRDKDLQGEDLRGANFQNADLRGANLRGANLQDADLQGANLRGANLQDADLRGANVDYSAWPLWCGSLEAYIDDRIAIQILYHLLRPVQASPYVSREVKERLLTDDLIDLANQFHRAEECGEIER